MTSTSLARLEQKQVLHLFMNSVQMKETVNFIISTIDNLY